MTVKNAEIQAKRLGEIVIYHRKKSGLTQFELAELAGIGKASVFDIEHGKCSVQFDTLVKLLNVLNISFELHSPLMQGFKSREKS